MFFFIGQCNQLDHRREHGRLYFDNDNESDDAVTPAHNKICTRSQGAVANLHNVQPVGTVVLERGRRSLSSSYQL